MIGVTHDQSVFQDGPSRYHGEEMMVMLEARLGLEDPKWRDVHISAADPGPVQG